MAKQSLGELQRVEVREYWAREDLEFTPWLSEAKNLQLLGRAIGVEPLELVEREARVGPYRADIVCKQPPDGPQVVIENQLEITDHSHLGQLLTYASGLNAAHVVWIARSFSDEHRAVLDWLNRITPEGYNFFGLEIELWRIGDSPPAPKFNLVCKPNGWEKARTVSGPDGELVQMWQAYWAEFRDYLRTEATGLVGSPRGTWMRFDVGAAGAHVMASLMARSGEILVGLTLYGDDAAQRFEALQAKRDLLEKLLGPLSWELRANEKKAWVSQKRKTALDVREQWPTAHAWFVDRVNAFDKAFRPLLAEMAPVPA